MRPTPLTRFAARPLPNSQHSAMESKQSNSSHETVIFRLFDEKPTSGLGFLDFPQRPLQPPPPCLEVLPSEVSASAKYIAEPVNVGGVTLLKGRVSTQEVFALANSDLVPGKYEGGLKLWEGSLDLITALSSEIKDGKLSFTGKRVLEIALSNVQLSYVSCCLMQLGVMNQHSFMCTWQCHNMSWKTLKRLKGNKIGSKIVLVFRGSLLGGIQLGCGHGLPGIFACQKGAASIHFQDFNAEVLQHLTIPNVNANVQKQPKHLYTDTNENSNFETRFFAGDWSEVHGILPYVCEDENEVSHFPQLDQAAGYDVILMAETVYSISALPNLYKLIKKCLSNSQGVVYMAAKKYYFGVGGGSRRFLSVVENNGTFTASLVAEVADGSSNVREVWKLLPK